MKSTICIITGATSGIGRETALALAAEGATLVLPVRNLEKGKKLQKEILERTKNKNVDIMKCELSSFSSIRSFAKAFKKKYKKLHILINNAGLWESKPSLSEDGIEMTFAVNHLAPFLLTMLLLDLIKKSAPARIINVSSSAHRMGSAAFHKVENGTQRWGSSKTYAQSKLANILFTKKLALMLAEDGVTVNCLHPGVVATRLFDKLPKFMIRLFSMLMTSPEKGAATSIYLATSPEVQSISGAFFANRKKRRPSSKSQNMQHADALWDLSLRMTGL